MALLEEMMNNAPLLSGEAKNELRKTFRSTKKSTRLVYGLLVSPAIMTCLSIGYLLAFGTKPRERTVHEG